ncbi:MAG: mannose-6-phosphate isomerase [Verrucomicrobiaceae bacterium]|nr:MAG: mannose-6-phosphate isomerase [Verrucomicrobiaceae bacterium]
MNSEPLPPTGLIRLQPLYMERVWGGRMLESLYGRHLPDPKVPFGESWEVVDRPDEQSVVHGGPLSGMTLNELWTTRRKEIFGANAPDSERFPLLIKILDARDKLSIQVHPPAAVAAGMGGEPKTEMWYIVDAEPGASLYAGVKPGVTPESFADALRDGTVEDAVPCLPVKEGDFIFIPSGRLHAIGAGLLIFEIQQNSDTTYRVFDWNRVGLDGKPRALHVEESLRCIDFSDTDPVLGEAQSGGVLVTCEYFTVRRRSATAGQTLSLGKSGDFQMLGLVSGRLETATGALRPGDWALIPANLGDTARHALGGPDEVVWLEVTFPG